MNINEPFMNINEPFMNINDAGTVGSLSYSRTCDGGPVYTLWRPLVGLDKIGRHREVAAICRSYVSPNF